jgi:hypothetical protein
MGKLSELDKEDREKVYRELRDLFNKRASAIDETLKSLYKTGLMINAGGITVLLPLLFKYLDRSGSYLLIASLLAFTLGILAVVVVQIMSVKRVANIAVGIRNANEDLRLDKISIEDWDAASDSINKAGPRIPNWLHHATFVMWSAGALLVFAFLFVHTGCGSCRRSEAGIAEPEN